MYRKFINNLEYKHMLLEPVGLRFNDGEEVIEFIDVGHATWYTYCCEGEATALELASIRKIVNSITGLAMCRVEGYNVISWEATDD